MKPSFEFFAPIGRLAFPGGAWRFRWRGIHQGLVSALRRSRLSHRLPHDQQLIEDAVCRVECWHARKSLLASVAGIQGDYVRVVIESGALGRHVICDDYVGLLGF